MYLFSDGVFEIEDRALRRWTMEDFTALVRQPSQVNVTEPQRLYEMVREASRPGPLEDDFSLVVLSFP
jgi:serine phosphatase RsbU (regulator of sigma subunit)